jgi:hypothetical protein
VAGGITLVSTLDSGSTAAWPISLCLFILCLFILVQTLYFYILPADSGGKTKPAPSDLFEQARHEAEKVLAQWP